MKTETNSPKEVTRLAIKGSVLPVIEALSSQSELSPALLLLKEKYNKRFKGDEAKKHDQSITQKVIHIFEDYWKSVLMERVDNNKAMQTLYAQLNDLAKAEGEDFGKYSDKSARDLSNYLKQKIENEGYHSLWGRTTPHLELMVWKKQTSKTYKVNIGENNLVDVQVELLEDFISYGWLGYATFNELHTGGWATKEKLFCVASKYDLESETFKISYLAHEGRHFSDFKLYPNLVGTDLEYRAKITELILAGETLPQLLRNFVKESSDDKASSHAYASFMLVKGLQKKSKTPDLFSMKPVRLKKIAQELLVEHTLKLNSLGAESVTSAFNL